MSKLTQTVTRQMVIQPTAADRRHPLLPNQTPPRNRKFSEMAGGTAAEVAAICCCCPCGLMNLVVLAVYKLPAGLCRRALRKKRKQRLKRAGLLPSKSKRGCVSDEIQPMSAKISENKEALSEKEVIDLEKEMWDKFCSTGFWRSPSQRE
ncbi:hypothetical protein GIB67_021128 [Kingdonia uniflora]|uniref:Pollen preferential protein n=1 Tax=Kingdonia uniflora TaxID=39325 RepID=A0A7J7N6X5_9MAGN|nr:hypothetical protein GIB67_021128 [Kingdonia uniflora]